MNGLMTDNLTSQMAHELGDSIKNAATMRDFLGFFHYFCQVCQSYLSDVFCSTKSGVIPDSIKTWATFCCSGYYKVNSKICCGIKIIET